MQEWNRAEFKYDHAQIKACRPTSTTNFKIHGSRSPGLIPFLFPRVMPLICCTSRVKAADDTTSLALSARHCYLYGDDPDSVLSVSRTRLPDNVDVLVASNFAFTISGSMDGETVSVYTVLRSQLALHLVEYFKTVMNSLDSIHLLISCLLRMRLR